MLQGSFGLRVAGLGIVALLGLSAVACGDDTAGSGGSTASSSTGDATGGAGGMGGAGGGTGGAGGVVDVCAADKSLCFDLNVPADFKGTPKSIFIGGYKMLPPAGPPDAFLGTIANPMVTPGMPYSVKLSDVTYTGDFFIYAVIFNMGTTMPVSMVDYVGTSKTPVTLNGAPATTAPIDMTLAP